MEYDHIHETVIRDILDVAQSLKDRDEVDTILDRKNGKSFSSISSKSKGLVMVFPVIGSDAASFESLAMISKAREKRAVVLLDLLFSAASITTVDDGEEFVKRFHTNLNTGRMTMDDFGKMMDGFVEQYDLIPPDSVALENYNRIMADLKSMNFYFEETLVEASMSDYTFITSPTGSQSLIGTPIIHEAPQAPVGFPNLNAKDIYYHPKINLTMTDRNSPNSMKNYSDMAKNDMEVQTSRIVDAEIKKANELAPSILYVNFISKDPDGGDPIYASFLVGVKAKLYVVSSQDIMNRLEIKHSDKNLLLNLIKVSSREISFFRDFIFAIDRAKIDALSQSRRGSSNKLWKVLERRAVKSKVRRALSMTNDATAISTLVITQEEVEYLKKTRYIDVENPRVIVPIMDAYNLMGFVIVDESLEIAKFLEDDGEGDFEVITYDNLEREQRDNSKKIVNLMSKMSR